MLTALAYIGVLALVGVAAVVVLSGVLYVAHLLGLGEHVGIDDGGKRADRKRARKAQIFDDMQAAKQAGRPVELPADWAD